MINKYLKITFLLSATVCIANQSQAQQGVQPRRNNTDNATNINKLRQLFFGSDKEQKVSLATLQGKPTDTSNGAATCEVKISETRFAVYVAVTSFDANKKYKEGVVWEASRSAKTSQRYRVTFSHEAFSGSQFHFHQSEEDDGATQESIALDYKTDGPGNAVTVKSVKISNIEGVQKDGVDVVNTPDDFNYDSSTAETVECKVDQFQ